MKYPLVEVNVAALEGNAKFVLDTCHRWDIEPTAVTKVVSAHPDLVRCLHRAGFRSMADSRLDNLRAVAAAAPGVQLGLLRLPMMSRAREVVEVADMSLNSEIDVIRALDRAAADLGRRHGVVIMVDVGDLREGIWPDEMEPVAEALAGFRNIDVLGVGTNLACYGGVIPDRDNMGTLVAARRVLEGVLGRRTPLVSGGNSATWTLLEAGELPSEVNNLRLGEVLYLGRESIQRRPVEGMRQDVFTLRAEVIEVGVKPSKPLGQLGQDAFGETHSFEDRGERLRAIAAVGRADVVPAGIVPIDPGVEILGASSDHLILDVEEAHKRPRVGATMDFRVSGYGALLQLFLSRYVEKEIVAASAG